MVHVEFTPNLARHLSCVTVQVPGGTLRAVLEHSCKLNPKLRGYLLDDQGRLRRHVTVFIDGVQVKDRNNLNDPVGAESGVFVAQALSGG